MDKYDKNIYIVKHTTDITKAADSWWNGIQTVELDQKNRKNDYTSNYSVPNFANVERGRNTNELDRPSMRTLL
ncbi:hypothetical protein ANCCAN_03258 [Ancylostoma caninum]|uniref:Uncharacterized protein n=1 Tax=Ancylostoma caninum TaxID=29170 RepID=A0A368H5U4_ANCCA|nr:hypothetical protein ANCCAN_03258 [Ancylostoma caninum]